VKGEAEAGGAPRRIAGGDSEPARVVGGSE
jgi:hypothetical protein